MGYSIRSREIDGVRHALIEVEQNGNKQSWSMNLEEHHDEAVKLNASLVDVAVKHRETELVTDPVQLNIDISTGCDMACPFCPYHGEKVHEDFDPHKRLMPLEMVEEILEQFPNARSIALGCSGEPFLHPKLPEIIKLCGKTRPYTAVQLSTDGLQFHRFDTAELLSQPNLKSINFSIDTLSAEKHQSWTKVKDSLNTAQRNLRRAAKWKYVNRQGDLQVMASSVVAKSECLTIGDAIDFYQDMELDYLGFQNYIPPDGADDATLSTDDTEILDYFRHLQATKKTRFRVGLVHPIDRRDRTNYCLQPWYLLNIDPDRNISPCCNVPRNARHGSFEDRSIWNADCLKDAREKMGKGEWALDYCRNCWANQNPSQRIYLQANSQ